MQPSKPSSPSPASLLRITLRELFGATTLFALMFTLQRWWLLIRGGEVQRNSSIYIGTWLLVTGIALGIIALLRYRVESKAGDLQLILSQYSQREMRKISLYVALASIIMFGFSTTFGGETPLFALRPGIYFTFIGGLFFAYFLICLWWRNRVHAVEFWDRGIIFNNVRFRFWNKIRFVKWDPQTGRLLVKAARHSSPLQLTIPSKQREEVEAILTQYVDVEKLNKK